MNTESYSLEALTSLKHQRLNACAELLKRTDRRLVFARSEALELLAIEKPVEPEAERRRKDMDVVVASAGEKTHIEGVRFLTWYGPLATILINRSIECTTPTCTWAHYSSVLDLQELIVLGDAMMRRNGHLARATPADFVAILDSAPQFQGIRNCHRALSLMREGTDSSQETRTRLALMRYGLPEPCVNHMVRLENGQVIFLDLAYPELRIAIEYDGGYHRFSSQQVLRDDKRREALETMGWLYIKVTVLDLRTPEAEAELAQRVAMRCEDVLGVSVPLRARMTMRQLCDGRHRRRKPLWATVPRHMWRARWVQGAN